MSSARRLALVPIEHIVAQLTDRIDALVREMLPLGRRENAEWREARTGKGGLGDSLSVHIGPGPRRGIWAVHGGTDKGDALDLVAFVRFGGDKKAAIIWAKGWLGLDSSDPAKVPRAPPPVTAAQADDEAREDEEKRRAAAQAMYLAGGAIEGSPVQRYLLGRGLDVQRLGFPLHAIRFHPRLWDQLSKRHWPAMVAAITDVNGKFVAVHRTYLEVLQNGDVRKAPILTEDGEPQAKRTLGSYRGGVIRLWRGIRIDPQTGEIKQAIRLAQCKSGACVDITEGIEDGLTVAIADPEARVLCAVSVSNMAAVMLPPCVERVVLWRQNDAPGSRAEAALDRAIDHFTRMGKHVIDCSPPAGIKDVNDFLCLGRNTQAGALPAGAAALVDSIACLPGLAQP